LHSEDSEEEIRVERTERRVIKSDSDSDSDTCAEILCKELLRFFQISKKLRCGWETYTSCRIILMPLSIQGQRYMLCVGANTGICITAKYEISKIERWPTFICPMSYA
jgi:hypothetical protein